jgi:hypothetical protein
MGEFASVPALSFFCPGSRQPGFPGPQPPARPASVLSVHSLPPRMAGDFPAKKYFQGSLSYGIIIPYKRMSGEQPAKLKNKRLKGDHENG